MMRKSKFIVVLESLDSSSSHLLQRWFTSKEIADHLDLMESARILPDSGNYNLVNYVSSEMNNLTKRKNPQVESAWFKKKRVWRLIPKY